MLLMQQILSVHRKPWIENMKNFRSFSTKLHGSLQIPRSINNPFSQEKLPTQVNSDNESTVLLHTETSCKTKTS